MHIWEPGVFSGRGNGNLGAATIKYHLTTPTISPEQIRGYSFCTFKSLACDVFFFLFFWALFWLITGLATQDLPICVGYNFLSILKLTCVPAVEGVTIYVRIYLI